MFRNNVSNPKSMIKLHEREKLILSWDANAPTKAQLTNLMKSKTSIFEKSRSEKEFNPYFQMAKTQECFYLFYFQ